MNGRHDVSKEQLGVTLAPEADTTGMLGMALRNGKICVCEWNGAILPHPGICSRPGAYCIMSFLYPVV